MVNNKSLDTSSLRQHHRGMVLRLIAAAPLSRSEIASRSGLSSMGVTRIVTELMAAGLVQEGGKTSRRDGPGRQGTRLRLRADGAYVFGVTISGFLNELVCVDACGAIRARKALRFSQITDPEQVIDEVGDALIAMQAHCGLAPERCLGIGAAISGIVSHGTGVVRQASPLGWRDVRFAELLRARTGLAVVVENLANALSLSQRQFGAAQAHQDMLLISAGTTIGASLTLGGALVRGANARAGQIGHSFVGEGPLCCSCGRRDCLNTRASGWAILVGHRAHRGS